MGDSMKAYAVIETGGKQYRVQADDTLQIERLDVEPGATVELKPVLAISDGSTLTIGKPHVDQAKVTAVVVRQFRGPKVIVFKKKRRKNSSRSHGHRQDLTAIKIQSIG